jgi:hypothetical protein
MPTLIINAGNIGTLSCKVTFNLATRQIVFDCTNSTFQGAGAGATNGIAFSLVDQVGLPLLSINWSAPQLPTPGTNLIYTFDASNIDFAFLFQSYTIIAAIQDGSGITYTTQPIVTTIGQPMGFQESGFAPGMFELRADCVNNLLVAKDYTLFVYQGLIPIQPNAVSGTLNYPTGSGVSPVAFTVTPFSNNVVYTGQYNITCTTAATYSLGNDVYVIVSYYMSGFWEINCSNKMADLLCCVTDLYVTKQKNCDNAIGKRAAQQLDEVNFPFFIGLAKEMNGADASREYEIVKKALNCNCGPSAIGQNQPTPINPSIYSIVITGSGGSTVTPGQSGNTKTFVVQSNTYQITKGVPSDPAFTIGLNTATPNLVQYPITFNYLALAQAAYTATASDPATLQQLNNLIQAIGIDLSGLNGGCVIDLTQATYTASQATTSGTGVVSIVINGTVYNAPTGLLANNITNFQTWLNSLTLGSFTVSLNNGVVTVVSINNTNTISTITYTSPDVTLQFQRTNFTLTQILQALVNYVCDLSALQVVLGANLSVPYFNYNGGVTTVNLSGANNTQNDFNQLVASSILTIINQINALTGVTCSVLRNIFSDNTSASWIANSRAYGTDGNGNCIGWTDFQLANMLIGAMGKYSSVMTAFCNAIGNCSNPGTCPAISAVNAAPSGTTSINFFGVNFATTTTANQTVSLYYKVNGASTWITASNSISIFPNGNINGTPNPFPISGLTPGTMYQIGVSNNCGGVTFVTTVTTNTSTVYNGSFLLNTVLYNICGGSPVTLYSNAPFATGITMYTDEGLTTQITGYTLIAPVATGAIYSLNSSSGVVGNATGNNCSGGTSGTYVLGNNTSSICSGSRVTLYTNGAFPGSGILYQDSALTTPQTGYSYVLQVSSSTIYALNSSTGVIGSSTGLSCVANVNLHDQTDITSFTSVLINGFSISIPGGFPTTDGINVTGTTSQLGTYTVVIGYNMTGPNNCMQITDSAGNNQSQNITSLNHSVTFTGVVINNLTTVQIFTNSGACD